MGFFPLCLMVCNSNPKNTHIPLNHREINVPDSLSLKEACIRVSSDLLLINKHPANGPNQDAFYRYIDRAGDSLLGALGDKAVGPEGAWAIIDLVYITWSIGFDPRDSLIETLLPHFVLANKKGACLGVSLIILMLAEKLRCPVYGVMLPGHFFCRYDNGKVRFNIEPNKSGIDHPDNYYRQRYVSGHRPWYDLNNLDKKQIIGVLCFNAGNSCLKAEDYIRARAYFSESVRRIPAFAEAKGNLALSFAFGGDLAASRRIFDTLFNACPDLNGLAANYGTVLMAAKDFDKAREVFSKGLVYFPADSLLISRRAATIR